MAGNFSMYMYCESLSSILYTQFWEEAIQQVVKIIYTFYYYTSFEILLVVGIWQVISICIMCIVEV